MEVTMMQKYGHYKEGRTLYDHYNDWGREGCGVTPPCGKPLSTKRGFLPSGRALSANFQTSWNIKYGLHNFPTNGT